MPELIHSAPPQIERVAGRRWALWEKAPVCLLYVRLTEAVEGWGKRGEGRVAPRVTRLPPHRGSQDTGAACTPLLNKLMALFKFSKHFLTPTAR